jgi:hypothetical protein
MVTGWMISGSSDVGEMVLTSPAGPPIANLMMSAPAVSLASWIAALKVHWDRGRLRFVSHTLSARFASGSSLVRLTVKVVSADAGLAASRLAATSAAVIVVSIAKALR